MGEQDERFGNYRLISRLGRGGMGETWHAVRDDGHGVEKDVVIKRVLRSVSDDPRFVEAFVSEARLSARLSHGNVAQVFEFGEVDGEHFMALEFVLGQPLLKASARAAKQGLRGLPPPFAIYVMMEVLKGLHHAHQRLGPDGRPLQIVHRDVSPDNVLVSYEGEVKVVDFGIAKAQYQGRTETEPGVVKGKYRYFSPEQATAGAIDPRSDVYSAGVVLYELLAGRLPIEGQPHVVLHKLLTGEYPRLGVTAPWLPDGLIEVVDHATRSKKEDRFESALQFQQALAEQLRRMRSDPSQVTVSGMMSWLFGPELAAMGRTVVVPGAVQSIIDAHRDATQRFARERVSQVMPAAPPPVTAEAQPPTAPRVAAPGRPTWQWVVTGAMVLAGFLATFALLEDRDPAPPAQLARPAPQRVTPAPAPAPPKRASNRAELAHAAYVKGRDLIDQQRYPEALTALHECLDADPQGYDCVYSLGVACMRDGQGEDAADWLVVFLKNAPPDHPDRASAQQLLLKLRTTPAPAPSAPVPPVPAPAAAPPPLKHGEVMDVVLEQHTKISYCLDEQNRREPDSTGVVQLRFDITAAGKVANLHALPSGDTRSYATGCLAAVIQPLKFPTGRATKAVVVPFRF
jgi:serine/threonine-protein kinase